LAAGSMMNYGGFAELIQGMARTTREARSALCPGSNGGE
jgi:hypothetical protein